MSVEQVKAFFDKVKEDSELALKLKDAQAAYTGEESDKEAAIAAIFVTVAAQAGFNFTVTDFNAAIDNNEEGEASENELSAVSGGVRNICSDFIHP
ncbi:MAG: Nif11-like leader peptide family RiPP precursor [Synergistaceae bacterium]|nr:Nif11-like leader peptide family RiPP precursor [Synergistaceae bacterium]